MRNLFILCLSVLFLLPFCSNNSILGEELRVKNRIQSSDSEVIGDTWKFDSLTLSKRVQYVEDGIAIKGGMRVNYKIVYPVSVPDNLSLKEIQGIFIRAFLGEENSTGTVQETFNRLLEEYSGAEEYSADSDDYGYEDTRILHILTNTQNLLTVAFSTSEYTGGAHGLFGVSYLSIDKRNGTAVTEKTLFKSDYKNKLSSLIQGVIADRNSSQDEDEHIGLLVDLLEVKANQNFYLSENGLVYVYNIYEIAPYAQGLVEIILPYKDILPLVNEKYLSIIADFNQKQF